MKKRTFSEAFESEENGENKENKGNKKICINNNFIQECKDYFNSNPNNKFARNAITSVGGILATTNSEKLNRISFTFPNSIRKKTTHATNQGASGRCWLFAGLNMFRHALIKDLELENFEFSETYLFFWDKLERSTVYLNWFKSNLDRKEDDLEYQYMLCDFLGDGGWWNTFANLVKKYGLVPKNCMKETYQSEDTELMNDIIKSQLDSCINYMKRHKTKDHTILVQDTIKDVYCILVKFLSEPPNKFDWDFTTEEDVSCIVPKLNSMQFANTVLDDIDLHSDFICLSNLPISELQFYKKYEFINTNNVFSDDSQNCQIFNVPINELVKYAMKSITCGVGVWFSADVTKSFNWAHSCLDDELDSKELIYEEKEEFSKGEKIAMRNIQGNHAMLIVGQKKLDFEKNASFLVENSWSFVDKNEPGLDGFLYMSQSWFEKYVIEIVVPKNILSRSLLKIVNETEAIKLKPWSISGSVTKCCTKIPQNYLSYLRRNRM